jgi:hypothetical protein
MTRCNEFGMEIVDRAAVGDGQDAPFANCRHRRCRKSHQETYKHQPDNSD